MDRQNKALQSKQLLADGLEVTGMQLQIITLVWVALHIDSKVQDDSLLLVLRSANNGTGNEINIINASI